MREKARADRAALRRDRLPRLTSTRSDRTIGIAVGAYLDGLRAQGRPCKRSLHPQLFRCSFGNTALLTWSLTCYRWVMNRLAFMLVVLSGCVDSKTARDQPDATTSCMCSNGGVCFEQIGGPPQSTPPMIGCAQVPDQGDRCALIKDQGRCTASTSVTGLCLCDNGIR